MSDTSVLSTLPTEVLLQILSSIERSELLKICLLSRTFHSISSYILYSHVTVSASTIHKFVRTILARKDLANYVKRLRCTWPLRGSHQWHALQVSLLLHLLPHLHVLDCTPPRMQIGENREHLNIFCSGQRSDTLPVGLQSVREIRSGRDENDEHYKEDWGSMTILLAMLKFPSIRKIQVHMSALPLPTDFDILYAAHARSSSVTDLEIVDSDSSPSKLQRILHVPKALTRFSYSHHGFDLATVDFPTIGAAITQHYATLQFLRFDFWYLQNDKANIVCPSIGSLRNWPMLTQIKSPLLPLLGMPNTADRLEDVLPLVIRELTIDWDLVWAPADVADAIVSLVQRKVGYGLARLEVINATRWLLRDSGHQRKVREACMAAGVRFQVVGYDWGTGVTYGV